MFILKLFCSYFLCHSGLKNTLHVLILCMRFYLFKYLIDSLFTQRNLFKIITYVLNICQTNLGQTNFRENGLWANVN